VCPPLTLEEHTEQIEALYTRLVGLPTGTTVGTNRTR